ncbi:hypothetical protein CORC01_11534 [Colletotrichum orchidophilum]|uniref:Uncharacterized protein n=1 Tax=Colletotrichum orchidophilum TaxID=1209926 RepID=A0A1G4AVP2_9PEZI|nr:uncharacterized protein CORC01_11534 [Colletotrichum orchidophilum]OHE93122.1 hypothetical protein CORC01_11534 [Colletotrichum orchidophilum]
MALYCRHFLIQLASERDKQAVCKKIGGSIQQDANEMNQVAFVVVKNPLDPKVETPGDIADALCKAVKFIAVDQLDAKDDCGYGPFSIDYQPKHGKDPISLEILRSRRLLIGARVLKMRLRGQ